MHSPMVTDAACFLRGWLSLSTRELCQGLEELRCDSEVSFISAAPAMRALRETGHSIASLALRFDFCCIPCKVGCKMAKSEVEFWSVTAQGTGWAITFNLSSAIQEWFGGSGGVQSKLSRWVAGAKALPTADAEVKAPHGLPSKSSTCGKTAALRTRVFHSLNYLNCKYFILFILLSIAFSPCLIFLIDVIDVVLLFGM